MKKKIALLAVLVLGVIASAYSVSGTYAKYTSQVTGSDDAIVAKWAVKLDDTDITTMSNKVSFNLFDVSSVYQLKDANFANGTDDENVKNAATDAPAIIAPGTWGKVSLSKITNESDVAIHYVVTLAATKQELPLKYSIDGGANWKDSIADLSYNGDIAVGGDEVASKTLLWKWDFYTSDDNDVTETGLGKNGTAKVELSATITATQID